MNYKPYSAEWSRKRYLAEAIQKYFEDNAQADVIVQDIVDILEDWTASSMNQTNKLNDVLSRFK